MGYFGVGFFEQSIDRRRDLSDGFVGLIAAPEGIKAMQEAHPDIDIFIAAIDDHLNERAYIVPGLGDAGDRQFGTG